MNPSASDSQVERSVWIAAVVAGCTHVDDGACGACLEQATAEHDQGLQRLIDALNVGVYRSTPAGELQFVNRALARMLGFESAAELQDRGVTEANYDPTTSRSSFMERMERDGAVRQQQACWKRRDGSDLWVRETARCVRDGEGRITSYEGFVEDITAEHDMWEALRYSEQRFQSVFENATVGLYRTSPDGRVLLANPAILQMLGYDSLEELQGLDVANEYADPAYGRADFLRQIEQDGEVRGNETTWRRKDGTAIPVRESARAVRDAAGATLYYEGTVEDLTERREAEAAMRQSEAAYHRVFESAQSALLVIDPERRTVLDVNDRACTMYGYARDQFVGMALERLGADPATRGERLAATLGSDGPFTFESHHRRADGRSMSLVVNSSVIEFRGRRAILSVNHDVTAQREAEEALRAREARFRGVFEHSPLACALFDAEGRLERANSRFCELLGYSAAELHRLDTLTLTHPDDRAHTAALAAELRVGARETIAVEKRYLRKDGTECWCFTSVAAIRGGDGKVANTIAMLQDLSALRTLEAQLLHAQKMEAVGRMAGGISHDFNNLLTAMSGYASLALRRAATGRPVQDELQELIATVDRAGTLTRQLLTFSRRQPLRPKRFDLVPLVTGLEGLLERTLGEDVELVVVPSRSPLWIEADPGQIEQVILNLAVNARDAMPRGGSLTLRLRSAERTTPARADAALPAGPYVVFEARDTGVGMDAMTRERMFEPFFTTKPLEKGTGLGLSTVYGIVRQSGGAIEVQSATGAGTTMQVWLPRVGAPAQSEPAVPRPDSHGPSGNETVLLVEDEAPLRRLLERVLQASGYRVVVARDGIEGLERFGEHGPFDVVVTDVVMPQMGGREMVTRLEVDHPDLRVLFISGYADDPELDARLQERGETLLHKPFSPSRLAHAVRLVLDRSAPSGA